MENFPMELRLEPREGRVAFRRAHLVDGHGPFEPGDPELVWHEFYWQPLTGWLDRRRLTDEDVADWIPLHVESEVRRRLLDDVLANAEERKVAIRIPKHADQYEEDNPARQWLCWWISEAGLTVELLTPPLECLWTSVYAEEETDGDDAH